MMRDDIQLGRVCRVLCALANRADYWAHESESDRQIGQLRPTPMAQEVALGKEGCSRGEMILVQVAWAFWNGETVVDEPNRLRFSDMLVMLDGMRTRAVAELMIAERSSETAHAVDAWLEKHEAVTRRTGERGEPRLAYDPGIAGEVVAMDAQRARDFFGVPYTSRVVDIGPPDRPERHKPGARTFRVYRDKVSP